MFRLLLMLMFASVTSPAICQTPVDSQLQNAIEPLIREHHGKIGLAIRGLSNDIHYEYNADEPLPTASLIKLPMLITAYRLVDEKQIDLRENIELTEAEKVPGSGVLTEHFSSGIRLPFQDYLRLMIRYSDNTATNIIADRIGLRKTAEAMAGLGFPNTKLHSKVYRGDTSIFPNRSQRFGIGSTTANEIVGLLQQLEAGKLASPESTQAIKTHLLQCDDRNKIAARLPDSISFAHKTGAISNCRTDAGLLYTSSGPVAICFLSNKNKDQSWSDDNAAHVLAARIGEIVVDRFGSPSTDGRLQDGAFGELVESLQRTLNLRLDPSPNLAIDGDFGPATRRAVERFQRQKQLEETGIVNRATWQALGTLAEEDAPVPPPEVVNSEPLTRTPQPRRFDPPIVTCEAWAVADRNGAICFEHNATIPVEAASTTKIMTAFLIARCAESNPLILDEEVIFSEKADNTVGSTAGVRAGEKISVRHLLYGLLLPSGNDASVALAEHFGARIAANAAEPSQATSAQANPQQAYSQFVSAMNAAAKELGMRQAHYTNTHGLSNNGHVISAADLVRLTQAALQFRLLRQICSTRQFGCTVEGEQGYRRNLLWKNTNHLLEFEGYTGVKTGTTSAAGACLVATGERDGDRLTVVTLGSSSSASRYADSRNLFRWAWQTRAASSRD